MNPIGGWSDLPEGILQEICKNFPDSYIENLRMRSVCSSWRSLVPPFRKNLSFPLQLPFPISSGDPINADRGGFFCLHETTIYLLQPLKTSSCYQTLIICLIKVSENNYGKMTLLNYFTRTPLDGFSKKLPEIINLMDFRVFELSKSYHLDYHPSVSVPAQFEEIWYLFVLKVVLSQLNYRILVIRGTGDLCSLSLVDQVWTVFHYESYHHFNDILHYKGKFYAVDYKMAVLVIDESSLELIRVIEPPLNGALIRACGRKHLVESAGDLFLILPVNREAVFRLNPCVKRKVKIFKLQENGLNWERVYDLGDQVLFVGFDCNFSISSSPDYSIYIDKKKDAQNFDRPRNFQVFIFNLNYKSFMPTSLGL